MVLRGGPAARVLLPDITDDESRRRGTGSEPEPYSPGVHVISKSDFNYLMII
jgi:hypothetical protein